MRYTERELHFVDAFALVLIGIGLLLAILGGFDLVAAARAGSVVFTRALKERARPGPPAGRILVEKMPIAPTLLGWTWTIQGVVFLCLGAALNVGLRRVIRNNRNSTDRGEDPGPVPLAARYVGPSRASGSNDTERAPAGGG